MKKNFLFVYSVIVSLVHLSNKHLWIGHMCLETLSIGLKDILLFSPLASLCLFLNFLFSLLSLFVPYILTFPTKLCPPQIHMLKS